MVNKKLSYNEQIAKNLTEFLSKLGIKFNVKSEPWLNVQFRQDGSSGPYRQNIWIFIYVWDTGELVTDPIVLHNWLNPTDTKSGLILPMEELDKITKDCKRVRDSIKRPKRGSVKSVIYAQLGEDEDGHATGKVEIKSDSIDRYRF